MIWLELAILLACIAVGARLGGIALGTVAGLGLLVFVFVLGLPPGGPPGAVLGMIIAVITALATMQAAGGLDYLVGLGDRIMRKRPQNITFVAPLVTYTLVLASGTTHVIYALLPVISEVSRKAGIRPERPLSISVIAGFQGVLASPISAATVALIGFLAAKQISLPKVMAVMIPATLVAVILGALSVVWRGRNLADDTEYQAKLARGEVKPPQPLPELSGKVRTAAQGSTWLFFLAILAVVAIGLFPDLRPAYQVPDGGTTTDQVDMGMAIMIVMLAAAGLTMMLFRASPEAALKGTMMRSGVSAIICILGVSWLGSSFFDGNRTLIVGGISGVIEGHPWTFAVGLFALSAMLFSAAATVSILIPVGVALGLSSSTLVSFYPAANAVFFLPTYGTLLAAVSFDQTGSTRIGKYLLNHSFMLPGLVVTVSAVIIAFLLSSVVGL